METIIYSAPTSLIFNGEQGILYGKPIITTAINRRATCSIVQSDHQSYDHQIHLITTIVKQCLKQSKIDYTNKHFHYFIDSTIPSNRAFYAFSAELVAIVSAVLYFLTRKEHQIDIVNNIVYEVEKKMKNNPLGFANTVSCTGGLVYYRREFEFLKGIYHLFIKIPQKIENKLFLVDTGEPEETEVEMNMIIGASYKKNPRAAETIFNEMEKCTKRIVISFMKEDASFFQDTMAKSQKLLEMLGVVSDRTKKIMKDISPYAVSKVLGLGGVKKGSGLLLCYVDDKKKFNHSLKKNQLVFYPLQQSLQGVKREVT